MTDEKINPDESTEENQPEENAAIDAFIDRVGKKFLRDLLVAYESQEDEKPAESNPDDESARQATAQLARGTSSEQESPEVEEAEPEEESKRGIAWRNGRRVGVTG